jgi:hypothetical protein
VSPVDRISVISPNVGGEIMLMASRGGQLEELVMTSRGGQLEEHREVNTSLFWSRDNSKCLLMSVVG